MVHFQTAAAGYRLDSQLSAPHRFMTLGSWTCKAGPPSRYCHIHIVVWNCQIDDNFVFWQFQLKKTAPSLRSAKPSNHFRSPGDGFGICGAGPVSTCKVHEFVLVRVIACLLSFYLFRLAARNGSSHCIGPKKKQATLLVYPFVVCFVRFVCLVSHFEPPEIYNSDGKRAVGLNICFTRCFFNISMRSPN